MSHFKAVRIWRSRNKLASPGRLLVGCWSAVALIVLGTGGATGAAAGECVGKACVVHTLDKTSAVTPPVLGARASAGAGSSSTAPVVSAPNSGLGGYYASSGRTVTEISAEWRIPAVIASRPGEAATWIGAQGVSGVPFVQLGSTEYAVKDHAASYHLFWSDPAQAYDAVNIATLKHPGDLIMFEMVQTAGGWNLVVKDRSSGWTRTAHVDYETKQTYSTGEWIQEDPAPGTVTTADNPYADTSNVTLQQLRIDGHVPHMALKDAAALSTPNGTFLVPTPVRNGEFSMVPAKGVDRQYLADAEVLNTSSLRVAQLLEGLTQPSATSERSLIMDAAKAFGRFADQNEPQKYPPSDRALVLRVARDSKTVQLQLNQWIASNGSMASLEQIMSNSTLGDAAAKLRALLGLPPV